jgi:hypothetical protein
MHIASIKNITKEGVKKYLGDYNKKIYVSLKSENIKISL